MSTASTAATSKKTTKARKATRPAMDISVLTGVLDAAKADKPETQPTPEPAAAYRDALASLSADAAERLNRALSLAFTAWSIAEHGGRASVSFGYGDVILDIGVSDVIGVDGDGQRLAVMDTVAI